MKIYLAVKISRLSGFTDAEGFFTVSILKFSNAFRLIYILSQKGDNLPILSSLILLFKGGRIVPHSKKLKLFLYVIRRKRNCYNTYDYFNEFPLHTKI